MPKYLHLYFRHESFVLLFMKKIVSQFILIFMAFFLLTFSLTAYFSQTPGILQFRARWRAQGQPQVGVLRLFSTSARHFWSAEAAAARLIAASPHANICPYLWSSASAPFHAGLACLAEERVSKTSR